MYNFVLLLIEWVRNSFSTMLSSVKCAGENVLVFFILREKC